MTNASIHETTLLTSKTKKNWESIFVAFKISQNNFLFLYPLFLFLGGTNFVQFFFFILKEKKFDQSLLLTIHNNK